MKLSKFHIFAVLTCAYAVFIFFLSSLSAIPSPTHHGLLRTLAIELMNLAESFGLKFIVYPLYFAYLFPDKFGHTV